MLLTITTTHQPATDLGFLLHKRPGVVREVPLAFGTARVFYTQVEAARCTAALMLTIDPVKLSRAIHRESRPLLPYVNDRPYVASSFMSVALSRVFGTAMGGRSKERPELTETAIPLEISLPCVPCRGGERLARGLFEPLGYTVETKRLPLDEQFPEWGDSHYYSVRISGQQKVKDLLAHLHVFLPVMDLDKHYWIGRDEMELLLRRGEGWLSEHPMREAITHRYLRYRPALARQALRQLADDSDRSDTSETEEHEALLEKPLSLAESREKAIVERLLEHAVSSVADLGCGEGKLIRTLLKESSFAKVVGVDVSPLALANAASRLKLDAMSERQRQRISLYQGSALYRDKRLNGFDGAVLSEVIEHIEKERLDTLTAILLGEMTPRVLLITTPNVEYNVLFENLPKGKLRHADHRFEWTRDQFERWCRAAAEEYGYRVSFHGIGELHEEHGTPTQMGVFLR